MLLSVLVSNLVPVVIVIVITSIFAKKFVYKDNFVYAVAIAGAFSVLLYLVFGPIGGFLDLLIWLAVVFGSYYLLKRR